MSYGLATAAAVAIVWELAAGRLINPFYLSPPSAIAAKLAEWIRSGYLWPHLATTFVTTSAGFAAAAVAGVGLALAIGSSRLLDRILRPFVYAAFSIPKVALAPIFIVWLGVGQLPALVMAALTGFFLIFFNAYGGVIGVAPALLNGVTLMGAGPLQRALKVRLPAALPQIVTGLRQGLVYAFHGAVIGEMTASNEGIGYVLVFAATDMDATGVLAGLAVLGTIAFALITLLDLSFRRLPAAEIPAHGAA